MLALCIKDDTLRQQVLAHIVQQLDLGSEVLDAMLHAGVDPEHLDRLRRIPARDLLRIAQMNRIEIHVGFNNADVIYCLDQLDAMRRDVVLLEYFVKHGALVDTIVTLFRVTKDAVRDLRRQFGMGTDGAGSGGARVGRPAMAPAARRQTLHDDWAKVERELVAASLRERYYALHQMHPDLNMAEMINTLSEFTRDQSGGRPRDFGASRRAPLN